MNKLACFILLLSILISCGKKDSAGTTDSTKSVSIEPSESLKSTVDIPPGTSVPHQVGDVYKIECKFFPPLGGAIKQVSINLWKGVSPQFQKVCIVGPESQLGNKTDQEIFDWISLRGTEAGWRWDCPEE